MHSLCKNLTLDKCLLVLNHFHFILAIKHSWQRLHVILPSVRLKCLGIFLYDITTFPINFPQKCEGDKLWQLIYNGHSLNHTILTLLWWQNFLLPKICNAIFAVSFKGNSMFSWAKRYIFCKNEKTSQIWCNLCLIVSLRILHKLVSLMECLL